MSVIQDKPEFEIEAPCSVATVPMSAREIWRNAVYGHCVRHKRDMFFMHNDQFPARNQWERHLRRLIGDCGWLDEVKRLCLRGMDLQGASVKKRFEVVEAFQLPDIDLELSSSFELLG